MKILFVSAVLPYPLHSGGQIRIFNLLKRLSKKHEIHLYAFIRSEQEKKYLSHLAFCKKVTTVMRGTVWQPKYLFKTLISSYSLLWSSYDSSEMRSLLAKESFDLVHIEPGYVFPSLPNVDASLVIAEHNIEHEVYQKYVNGFKVPFLKPFLSLDVAKMSQWEKRVWKKAAAIIAVSEDDKSKIEGNVHVVPNGINIPAYPFKPKKHVSPFTFLYTGNFTWMENRDAADNILKNYWPVIKKQYPDAKLRIVGKGAPDGAVEHIQDELQHADILLAPIRIGGGTKFKILEAMACGLPVVTTKIGAEGLDTKNIWIADTPEELRIPEMLQDIVKIKSARLQIEKEYNWDTIAGELDNIWTSQS